MAPDIQIAAESYDLPEVTALVAAMYREEAILYGEAPDGTFPRLHLPPGRSVFLVARVDGEAIACGGVTPLEGNAGEVKRMYVRPEWRGQRVADRILSELEGRATGMGYRRLRLETGVRQPAAIRLYERLGFRRIPCYEPHAGDPLSVCFEKVL